MFGKSWLLIAFAAVTMLTAAASGFAADVDSRFAKVCRDDILKNNPVWTEEQLTKICACRLRFFHAEQSKQDLALFVTSFESGELSKIPDDVNKADVRYIGICMKDWSAQP